MLQLPEAERPAMLTSSTRKWQLMRCSWRACAVGLGGPADVLGHGTQQGRNGTATGVDRTGASPLGWVMMALATRVEALARKLTKADFPDRRPAATQ